MSDRSSRFGPSGSGPSDQSSGSIGSLVDVWVKGLTAWQEIAEQSSCDTVLSDGASNPFDAVIRAVAEIAASLGVPVLDAAGARAGGEGGQAAVSHALAQSGLAAAASVFRYGCALGELLARYRSSLIQVAADRASGHAMASPADCRVFTDELRAFLRQVGDTAMQEARHLQQELEVLGESVARTAGDETPTSHADQRPPRRTHRVKA